MFPFEFGVAKFFTEVFDTRHKLIRFGGCSAGAAVASGLALGLDFDAFFEEALTIYEPCKYLPFEMCDGVKKVGEAGSLAQRLLTHCPGQEWAREGWEWVDDGSREDNNRSDDHHEVVVQRICMLSKEVPKSGRRGGAGHFHLPAPRW